MIENAYFMTAYSFASLYWSTMFGVLMINYFIVSPKAGLQIKTPTNVRSFNRHQNPTTNMQPPDTHFHRPSSVKLLKFMVLVLQVRRSYRLKHRCLP